ncbi:MAG TPA: hypothetical protein VHR47_14215 [Bacillota bacterium]|nr:hypothetical protein [Bacillota bacterium]
MGKRFLGFLLILGFCGCLIPLTAYAGNDLSASLPQGAKILQVIADPGLDSDPKDELLVLVSVDKEWQAILLDNEDNGYTPVYQVNLGNAGLFTPGYTSEPYAVLQVGDVNGDGITDFWMVYQSMEHNKGELQVFASANGTFRNVLDVQADYDIRFVNYEGDLAIHQVDRLADNGSVMLKSFLWKQDRFDFDPQSYKITTKDYLLLARNRWRPQLFSGRKGPNPTNYRWGSDLIRFAERPLGRTAITALLPEKAYLLDFLSDPALDLDTDTEYLVAYLVPDPTDSRRVFLKAGVVDWDLDKKQYQLVQLDVQDYGLARHPEGNFYRPLYLLRGNGLSHVMILGNAASDKPLIQLTIFNNSGKGFTKAATFQGSLFAQLTQQVGSDGEYYKAVTADSKDGRVTVKTAKATPEGEFGACGAFRDGTPITLSIRDFKREFYSSEETEWIIGGYETPLLSTMHARYTGFTGMLPEAFGFKGNVEDYVFKHLADLRVRSWRAEDFDGDGSLEVLALLKVEDQSWPPVYRLGYFYTNGLLVMANLVGPSIKPDERLPLTGAYLADIGRDKQREVIIVARDTNPETRREGVHLEIRKLVNGTWISINPREIWYDELNQLILLFIQIPVDHPRFEKYTAGIGGIRY